MHEAKPTLIALVAAVAVLSGATLVAPTAAQEPADPYVHIPTTISEAWQAQLRQYPNPDGMNAFPPGDDVEAWGRLQGMMEEALGADYDAVLESNGATAQRRTIGGVPVLEVRPRDWEDNGKLLVYVHGGAYTLGSVVSTVGSAVYGAEATGLRVISIDYTLTPQARWRQITDEVVAVFAGLEDEGVAFDDIAIFGDSAGGGLAPGAVLKMRDQGMGMPAAVVLWSPWADITEAGDTYVTLRDAEPNHVYAKHLAPSADAYADPADQLHPYVSPVYGDYTEGAGGFPPTLIQGGTKEIFLSNFVRLYQALDNAGQTVKLDLYEGMPHVFQAQLPASREGATALGKMAAFLDQYLGG